MYRKFNVVVQCSPGWEGYARRLIVVCSSCGRLRRADGANWEWAPGLVTRDTERVSHGICGVCDLQYYDDSDSPK